MQQHFYYTENYVIGDKSVVFAEKHISLYTK